MNAATFEYIVWMFACSMMLIVGIYVFLPSRDQETGEDKTRLSYLYERKEVVYENLRDLNFEFKSGKFTQADYDSMRVGLEAEAARVLAEIEHLETAHA